jgi:hypothetical protein
MGSSGGFSSRPTAAAKFAPFGPWLASFANIFSLRWCHRFSALARHFRWLSTLLALWQAASAQKRW